MKKNHFTLFLIKFYGSTLIFSHLWSTSAEFYDFEKNPFRQICPLRAFFRSSQFELFFFELPLHHQFWSDIQNLCDMHTSWPRGFHRMLWMVPRFIRLGGVTPPKYMVLFFGTEEVLFRQKIVLSRTQIAIVQENGRYRLPTMTSYTNAWPKN